MQSLFSQAAPNGALLYYIY